MQVGYLGLIIGAAFAGLVYIVIALIVKKVGVNWLNKLMPAVVVGPTVAIIGLSLAGNAVKDLVGHISQDVNNNNAFIMNTTGALSIVCGLVTLFTVIICSVYGKKMAKMIPFIIGIVAGYAVAAIFTGIGYAAKVDALKVIDFTKFKNMQWYPDFAFIEAFKGFKDFNGAYLGTIAVAYVPVAFVVFAEHIADHKNLSSIIEHDLLTDPGLDKTLLGDGVGSIAGAFFGGCPNTTYGESVGCVAISGNASGGNDFHNGDYGDCNFFLCSVRNFPGYDSRLRNGRRVYRFVRFHRGIRLEDDSKSRPWRQQEPVCGIGDSYRGYRRLRFEIWQSYDHFDCVRPDSRYSH